MIYETLTESKFIRAFDEAGRSDSFSIEARRRLFDYYEDLSDSMAEDIELHPNAICCDWTEFTARELFEKYRESEDGFPDPLERITDELKDAGVLLTVKHVGEPDTYLFRRAANNAKRNVGLL